MNKKFMYVRDLYNSNLCTVCRKLLGKRTICSNCGDWGETYIPRKQKKNEESCSNHPAQKANQFCNFCDKYYCKKCFSKFDGISLLGGYPTKMCKLCNKIANKNKKFPKRLCMYHPIGEDKSARIKCSSNNCDIWFCSECAIENTIGEKH